MRKKLVLLFSLGLGVVTLTSVMAFGQTAGPQMYDILIAAGTDDAEEHLNAGMDITSSDLEIPYEDSGTPATDEQLIGMRWIVPIAKGFAVGKAYLEFELKETKGSTNTAPVNVIVEGQLLANPPAFTSTAKDITNRTRTKAQVKWTIPPGMTVGTRFQTPDISSIITEIISQDGWAGGNALVIILRDDKSAPSTGLRCVHAYDGSTIGAPLLHIQPPWPWATKPNPADGATGVSQALFSWTAGEGAVVHNVYVGTSPELTEANLVAKNQPFAVYFHAPGFAPDAKYYWRVDESDGVTTHKGDVWSFSVADYLIMDDMESYTDKEGEEIYTAWVDGFTDQSSGSTVGLMTAVGGTFGETTIVHGGRQSMPMAYDNSKSPYYSEAVQAFAPLQDWTAYGVTTLTLFWRGSAANGADKLHVAVEDSAGKQAVVANADPAAAKVATWTEWKIPLGSLTGVNPAKVKKLYVGVGDRKAPALGGTGTVDIDDIRLTKP